MFPILSVTEEEMLEDQEDDWRIVFGTEQANRSLP
jgi:hypothetical protein